MWSYARYHGNRPAQGMNSSAPCRGPCFGTAASVNSWPQVTKEGSSDHDGVVDRRPLGLTGLQVHCHCPAVAWPSTRSVATALLRRLRIYIAATSTAFGSAHGRRALHGGAGCSGSGKANGLSPGHAVGVCVAGCERCAACACRGRERRPVCLPTSPPLPGRYSSRVRVLLRWCSRKQRTSVMPRLVPRRPPAARWRGSQEKIPSPA